MQTIDFFFKCPSGTLETFIFFKCRIIQVNKNLVGIHYHSKLSSKFRFFKIGFYRHVDSFIFFVLKQHHTPKFWKKYNFYQPFLESMCTICIKLLSTFVIIQKSFRNSQIWKQNEGLIHIKTQISGQFARKILKTIANAFWYVIKKTISQYVIKH